MSEESSVRFYLIKNGRIACWHLKKILASIMAIACRVYIDLDLPRSRGLRNLVSGTSSVAAVDVSCG